MKAFLASSQGCIATESMSIARGHDNADQRTEQAAMYK